MRVKLPDHGSCYICGTENPRGMGVAFYQDEGVISATVTLLPEHQGPPGHAHGGALSAILDEAMGAAAWCAGKAVLAAKLEISFRAPTPLGAELIIAARVVRQDGRKVFVESEVRLPGGRVCVEGKGLFIEAREFYAGRATRSG